MIRNFELRHISHLIQCIQQSIACRLMKNIFPRNRNPNEQMRKFNVTIRPTNCTVDDDFLINFIHFRCFYHRQQLQRKVWKCKEEMFETKVCTRLSWFKMNRTVSFPPFTFNNNPIEIRLKSPGMILCAKDEKNWKLQMESKRRRRRRREKMQSNVHCSDLLQPVERAKETHYPFSDWNRWICKCTRGITKRKFIFIVNMNA